MNKNNNMHKLDKEKNVIGIEQFIINYLNDGNYVTCNDLTHKQLKTFKNPYVKGIPFEILDAYMDYVYEGSIIIVRDVLGRVAPYINPSDLKEVEAYYNHEKVSDIDRVYKILDLFDDMQAYNEERNDKNVKKH